MNFNRKLNQYATYWAPKGLSHSNATLYAAPIEIRCRWEDSQQDMIDANGEKWTSKSAIDTTVPLLNLGILWKGRLKDIAPGSDVDPLLNPGASAIRSLEDIPNRKATQALITAYL